MGEFFLRFRVPLSAAHTLFLMLLAVLLVGTFAPRQKSVTKAPPPIELTFIQPEIQAEPPPATPQPPAQPVPRIPVAAPRPVAKAVEVAAPVQQAEIAEAPPLSAAPPLPMPSNVAAPPPAPALAAPAPPPAAPPPAGREAEAAYVGKVRAYLQGIKRYPTGREASLQRPAGVATVWFILRRSGELVEAALERGSGSMLLDNTALATVRRGVYPAFPDDAWAGKAQQRFSVELDFVPTN